MVNTGSICQLMSFPEGIGESRFFLMLHLEFPLCR